MGGQVSAPPDVLALVDLPWLVLLPDEADVPAWAHEQAQRVWTAADVVASRDDVQRLAEQLSEVAGLLTGSPLVAAFLLLPEPGAGITAVARLQAVETGEGVAVEELLEELTAEVADLVAPPETTLVDTAAGPAHRLVQRTGGSRGTVVESVQYVWSFPVQGAALVLGTAFTDLLEAQRWRASLDVLAAGLALAEVAA